MFPNIFVVACLSPTIDNNDFDFKQKIKRIDEKNLLETKHVLFKQLDVTYRNSLEIQMFYNIDATENKRVNSHIFLSTLCSVIWRVICGLHIYLGAFRATKSFFPFYRLLFSLGGKRFILRGTISLQSRERRKLKFLSIFLKV